VVLFMNVTFVCSPALTVTVAVPAPRLLLTSNPALGIVLTAVSAIPLSGASENWLSVIPKTVGLVGSA
jgi:hypothetical protein